MYPVAAYTMNTKKIKYSFPVYWIKQNWISQCLLYYTHNSWVFIGITNLDFKKKIFFLFNTFLAHVSKQITLRQVSVVFLYSLSLRSEFRQKNLIFATFLFEVFDSLEVKPLFLNEVKMMISKLVTFHLLILTFLLGLYEEINQRNNCWRFRSRSYILFIYHTRWDVC